MSTRRPVLLLLLLLMVTVGGRARGQRARHQQLEQLEQGWLSQSDPGALRQQLATFVARLRQLRDALQAALGPDLPAQDWQRAVGSFSEVRASLAELLAVNEDVAEGQYGRLLGYYLAVSRGLGEAPEGSVCRDLATTAGKAVNLHLSAPLEDARVVTLQARLALAAGEKLVGASPSGDLRARTDDLRLQTDRLRSEWSPRLERQYLGLQAAGSTVQALFRVMGDLCEEPFLVVPPTFAPYQGPFLQGLFIRPA